MISRILSTTLAVAAVSIVGSTALAGTSLPSTEHSPDFSGHRFAGEAKINLRQARAVAVRARPGVFTDEELEHERGGSGLRYSFDIRAASGRTYEVGVDARTGRVLENDREGPDAD